MTLSAFNNGRRWWQMPAFCLYMFVNYPLNEFLLILVIMYNESSHASILVVVVIVLIAAMWKLIRWTQATKSGQNVNFYRTNCPVSWDFQQTRDFKIMGCDCQNLSELKDSQNGEDQLGKSSPIWQRSPRDQFQDGDWGARNGNRRSIIVMRAAMKRKSEDACQNWWRGKYLTEPRIHQKDWHMSSFLSKLKSRGIWCMVSRLSMELYTSGFWKTSLS